MERRYFRKTKPAEKLYVLSIEGMSREMKLMITAIQGIINQRVSKIYLVSGKDTKEEQWLNYYKEEFGITSEKKELPDVCFEFRNLLNGYVIYDTKIGATVNIACTLAGLENTIPVHPDFIDGIKQLGFSESDDLRARWQDNISAYYWAIEKLLQKCNKRLIGHTPVPDSLDDVPANPPEHGFRIADRDLLIANKSFMFSVGNDPVRTFPGKFAEKELVETIYGRMEPFTSVLGWMNWWNNVQAFWESDYVLENSRHGFNTICGGGLNFSVHCNVGQNAELKQKPPEGALKVEDKIYVCFGLSDGDALWCIHGLFGGLFDKPDRPAFSLGWSMNPLITEFAPAIYQYYLKKARLGDCFVASTGGSFYLYPSEIYDLNGYADINDYYLNNSDIHVIMGLTDVADNTDAYLDYGEIRREKIAKYLSKDSLEGVIEGYGPRYRIERNWSEQVYEHKGKPWLLNIYEDDFTWFAPPTAGKVISAVDKILKKEKERPLFLPFFFGIPHGTTLEMINEVVTALNKNPEIKVVRPDEFVRLFREWKGNV